MTSFQQPTAKTRYGISNEKSPHDWGYHSTDYVRSDLTVLAERPEMSRRDIRPEEYMEHVDWTF